MSAPIRRAMAAVVLGLTTLAATDASAEWFVDVYGGRSWTRPADVDIDGIDVLGVPVHVTLEEVDPRDSLLVGVRAGYWLGFLPDLGLAVDAFYFRPDVRTQTVIASGAVTTEIFDVPITVSAAGPVRIPAQDIPAVAVSLDLMVRWRLYRSDDAPHGRVQPYLFAGPAFLFTDPDTLGTSAGVKTGGGVAVQVLRRLAVFAEYRFTHFEAKVRSGRLTYEATVETHHAVAGLSLRF